MPELGFLVTALFPTPSFISMLSSVVFDEGLIQGN